MRKAVPLLGQTTAFILRIIMWRSLNETLAPVAPGHVGCIFPGLNSGSWRGYVASRHHLRHASRGATPPEGITADDAGNIYADHPRILPVARTDRHFRPTDRVRSLGSVIRQMAIAGASPHLLGLAFNPTTSDLLVLDLGAAKVLKVNPQTGASTVFSDIGGGRV